MGESGTVSVVIPTYYRNDRLESVLRSVFDQTYSPLEVILVDDSGEAHARPVAERLRDDGHELAYVHHELNRGAQAARDHGYRLTSGAYVQFLDDDDRLVPEKFEKQVSLLEESPDVGVVYSGLRYENGEEKRPDPSFGGDVLPGALAFEVGSCVTSTMLARRVELDGVTPLDHDSPGADDLGLVVDLARRTAFEYVDEPLVVKGTPPDSRGTSWGGVEGRWRLLRRYDELYDQHAPAIRRRALANTYAMAGRRHIEERVWSPRAVLAFLRAVYHHPDPSPRLVAEATGSLFGRPGRALASSGR